MNAPTLWHYPKAVLWSFFGIRRGAAAREELSSLHPLGLIAFGVALAAGFVLLLLTLARSAVAWLAA